MGYETLFPARIAEQLMSKGCTTNLTEESRVHGLAWMTDCQARACVLVCNCDYSFPGSFMSIFINFTHPHHL